VKLNFVYDSTLLSKSKVYQIQGILYRFLYKDGSIQHPQYLFRPLPGQRKKADLQLNHSKLITRCQEVEGMTTNVSVVDDKSIQMSFF
jgi:hypothetical protein